MKGLITTPTHPNKEAEMLNSFSFADSTEPNPPEIDPSESPISVWLCQLVPPRILNPDKMMPSMIARCNWWLKRWNCETRYFDLESRDKWLDSLNLRSPIPVSQS